mmetsp:Transcript_10170/g.14928  ORF Transcript_10170/g.14928 Transcript_10170/m.14928 type:complete len:87 (-) Transcript_10170:201-461(-)
MPPFPVLFYHSSTSFKETGVKFIRSPVHQLFRPFEIQFGCKDSQGKGKEGRYRKERQGKRQTELQVPQCWLGDTQRWSQVRMQEQR